jgi:TolA-binding protein
VSRAVRALPALLLLAGCAASRPAPAATPTAHVRPAPATRLVAYADELAERGEAREAVLTYERVVRDYPADPAAAGALYGLGRVQASAPSPARNYRGALAAFTRVLSEYPGSGWEADARAWKAALVDLLAREEEAARLRSQIERLRRTDLELERRR